MIQRLKAREDLAAGLLLVIWSIFSNCGTLHGPSAPRKTDNVPCVNTTDPSKSVVQGSVIKGVVPPMNLQPVPDCSTTTGYVSLNWLNGVGGPRQIAVTSSLTGTIVDCTKDPVQVDTKKGIDNPCQYIEGSGTLNIDKSAGVTVLQGNYCLGPVNIKNPITLQYDADQTKVAPVRWDVTGPVKLDDKVANGTTLAENESVPWLFMILSSCDASTCKDNGVEVKIGDKTPSSNDGLYGYIYAPSAAVKFNDKGDFFGAAVGRKLTLDKHSELSLRPGPLEPLRVLHDEDELRPHHVQQHHRSRFLDEWLIVGQFMYPKDAPARLVRLAASGGLRLDAVVPRTYALADLPRAMDEAAAMRGLEITALVNQPR